MKSRLLTRNQFVKLCTDAIKKTKRNICADNQLSGYKRFHRETRDNHYIERFRTIRNEYEPTYDYSLFVNAKIIEHIGIGRCYELAEYLGATILAMLKKAHAEATINIVSSKVYDHSYVQIDIQLKNETVESRWEVDAWDPRLIDITTNLNDLTFKNVLVLIEMYGIEIDTYYSMTTEDYERKKYSHLLPVFFKPQAGPPSEDETDEDEMLVKNEEFLYSDRTLARAYRCGLLHPHGKIQALQKPSDWQIDETYKKRIRFEEW